MRDLKSNIDVAITVAPQAMAASKTGAAVDLQGYDAAFGEFSPGAWTDGTHTPKLQESADGTTFTDVGTGDLQGSFSAVTTTGGAHQRVGYIGAKRYVRGFVTVAGATTGMLGSVNIVRGRSSRKPL